jgi:hypothetical protein
MSMKDTPATELTMRDPSSSAMDSEDASAWAAAAVLELPQFEDPSTWSDASASGENSHITAAAACRSVHGTCGDRQKERPRPIVIPTVASVCASLDGSPVLLLQPRTTKTLRTCTKNGVDTSPKHVVGQHSI